MNMKYFLILIMLSETMNTISAITPGICSNSSIGEPLKCCQNYRQVGEACEECWPGTYGWDCIPCPSGFYGRLCKKSCNVCAPCDPVSGCVTSKNSTGRLSTENKNQGAQLMTIAISVSGSCGVGFTVFIFNYCKHRKSVSKRCQENRAKSSPDMQINNSTNGITRENEALMNLQNENDSSLVDYGPYDTLNLKSRHDFEI